MHWVVEVETVDGALADEAAFEAVAARLREDVADCLVAFHAERGVLAAWVVVDADDASSALRRAEAAVGGALTDVVAPGGDAATLLTAAAVRRAGQHV